MKKTRKQRIDILACELLEEVLKDLRIEFTFTQDGFIRRRTNLPNQRPRDESNSIFDEVALSYTNRFYNSENPDIFRKNPL